MGFFGLRKWVESDEAADFRWVLQQQFKKFGKDKKKLKLAIRKVVEDELDNMANEWNTPGFINLALCIESEGEPPNEEWEDPGLPKFSHLLTVAHLKRANRLFTREIPEWDAKLRPDLKRLHKVIDNLLNQR